MPANKHNAVQLLADWLRRRPQDFYGAVAMGAVDFLLEHAGQVLAVATQHRQHAARWALLPEGARQLASRRQVAALAARLAMRNGMESSAAVAWVIAIAGMGRREFKQACERTLTNGDRLYVWQWRELTALALCDDFMSRRQIERWLELEEPWLLDERWVHPLHLVDQDVLAQLAQGECDAAE